MWDNPEQEFEAARKRSEEVRMLTYATYAGAYATYAGAYADVCYVSKRLRARGARRFIDLVIF